MQNLFPKTQDTRRIAFICSADINLVKSPICVMYISNVARCWTGSGQFMYVVQEKGTYRQKQESNHHGFKSWLCHLIAVELWLYCSPSLSLFPHPSNEICITL